MEQVILHPPEMLERVRIIIRKTFVDILGYMSCPISNTLKKAVYIGFDDDSHDYIIEEKATPNFNSYWSRHTIKAKTSPKIFISKKCSTPRALLRPEFSIVRDPDKADYVVVQDELSKDWRRYTYRVVIEKSNGMVVLADIEKDDFDHKKSLSPDDVQKVRDALDKYYKDAKFYYHDDMRISSLYTHSKNQEYEDIVLNTYPNRNYVFESLIEYDTPTKLNADALQIMSKMDEDQLEGMILGSDWREYPYTIFCLLDDVGHLSCPYNTAFASVQKYVNNRFNYPADPKKEYITSKDYNLLQKWLMKKLGVPEEGGLASISIASKIDSSLLKMIRRRLAVKPNYIDESNDSLIRRGDIIESFD